MITRNSRASKRWMVAATAAVVCGSTLAISGAASAGPGLDEPDADRISGANRYATAAEINSDNDFGLDATDVIIANGLDFPDGLTASVLSALDGATILLTDTDEIPAATLAELERIDDEFETAADEEDGITSITVVGGTAAVSGAVYADLEDFADPNDIQRIRGANRYETALEVGEEFAVENGGIDTVIIATGLNFPDALAAGPLAIDRDAPILLTDGPRCGPTSPSSSRMKGSPTPSSWAARRSSPATVELQLKGPLGLDTTRLSGSARDGTAVAIAEELYDDTGQFVGAPGVVAVNGFDFPDALAAGPFAAVQEEVAGPARTGYPILLVGNDSIPAATATWHVENCASIGQIFAVGGTAVISNTVVTGAVDAATCSGPDITSATLVVDNLTAREVDVLGGGGSGDDGADCGRRRVGLGGQPLGDHLRGLGRRFRAGRRRRHGRPDHRVHR